MGLPGRRPRLGAGLRRGAPEVRWPAFVAVAAAVLTSAASCGEGETVPAGGMFRPLHDSAALTMEATEVVRVGGGGADTTVFERVSSLAVGPDGRIWVLDGPAGRVVVLDGEGREVRSFGGQGQGPGEFTVASDFGFVGDTLWVIDAFSRRTTFFSLEGDVLGTASDTVSVDPARFRDPARPVAYLEGGYLLVEPAARAAGSAERSAVIRVHRESRARDTLAVRAAWTTSVPLPTGSFGYNPLSDHALVSTDPRGRWTVVAERPGDSPTGEGKLLVRVLRRAAGDSVAFDVRYVVDGTPVSAATRDSVVEAGVERLRENMEAISELRETIEDPRAVMEEVLRLPPFHPPLTGLVAASDSTTWLARQGTNGGVRTWTVLGPGGEVLRHVRVPVSVSVRDASAERMWGVETDELDVQHVVGFELVRAGEG